MTVLSNIITPSNVLTTTNTATVTNKTLTSPTVTGMVVSDGTANGVTYLNGSKVLTSGAALTFNGTNTLAVNASAANLTLGISTNYGAVTATGTNPASIYFNGGSRSGFESHLQYFGANHTFFNETGGSEIMRLLNTGNVGIGTSSPDQALVVNRASNSTYVKVSGPNNTGFDLGLFFTDGTNQSYFGQLRGSLSGTAGALATITGGAIRTVLDSSGNFGIGVTNPVNKLALPNATYIAFKDTSGNESMAINGTSDNALAFLTNGAEKSRIDSSGSLLVGTTTSPTTGAFPRSSVLFKQLNDSGIFSGIQLEANANTNVLGIGYDGSTFAFGTSYRSTGSYIPISFSTGGSERARIDTSGRFLLGGTTADNSAFMELFYNGLTFNGIVTKDSSSSGTTFSNVFVKNGSIVGSISQTTSLTTYNATSDYRLKNNQNPLTGSGAFIDALKPKTWDWAQDGSKGVGFIAHEFAEVSPSSVSGEKDAVDANGNPVYQAMQASTPEVIANLVAEIQSLRQRLSAANL